MNQQRLERNEEILRMRLEEWQTYREIADKFGLSTEAVRLICYGKDDGVPTAIRKRKRHDREQRVLKYPHYVPDNQIRRKENIPLGAVRMIRRNAGITLEVMEKARFYKNVPKDIPHDQCWPWQGYFNKYGKCGIMTRRGKTRLAHRIMYEYERGEIPKHYRVLHTCGNNRCINPYHLELYEMHRLTAREVAEARLMHARDPWMLYKEIKFKLGIKAKLETLRAAIVGLTWKHVPETEAELIKFLEEIDDQQPES